MSFGLSLEYKLQYRIELPWSGTKHLDITNVMTNMFWQSQIYYCNSKLTHINLVDIESLIFYSSAFFILISQNKDH